MSQWKNDDSAANSVLWGPTNLHLTPNSANRDALFGNSTANAFINGVTIGTYGVDTGEMQAIRKEANGKPAHAGWVMRTEGSGGRAGRVTYEVLVAMGSMTSDAEDTILKDYTISIVTNPSNTSGNSTANAIKTFSVNAISTPTGATLTYQWQANTGAGFANISNAGAYSNVTTSTVSVLANTVANGTQFRVLVAATAANTKTSNSATITITT